MVKEINEISSPEERKKVEVIHKTQGYKKTITFLKKTFNNEEVLKRLIKIRKKYDINSILDYSSSLVLEILYSDKNLNTLVRELSNKTSVDETLIKNICFSYILTPFFGIETTIETDKNIEAIIGPLTEYQILKLKNLCVLEETNKEFKHQKMYPITLNISPYASKRDILDFVNNVFSTEILPLQNKYKKKSIKLGKTRKENPEIRKRNEFIYKHKDLPRKEIAKLLSKEFKVYLDVGYVGKIISMIEKDRK